MVDPDSVIGSERSGRSTGRTRVSSIRLSLSRRGRDGMRTNRRGREVRPDRWRVDVDWSDFYVEKGDRIGARTARGCARDRLLGRRIGTAGGDDPGRPGGGRGEGRVAGARRRAASGAVPARRHDGLLHELQSQQAGHRGRPAARGGSARRPRPAARRRRVHPELAARGGRAPGSRMGRTPRAESAADPLLGQRLRTRRPLRPAPGLRPHHPGHHGTRRRPGEPGSADPRSGSQHRGRQVERLHGRPGDHRGALRTGARRRRTEDRSADDRRVARVLLAATAC